MVSGGRGGGLPRVSEAQMSRAEHLPAPIGGPLRPEPDLFLPGRQQEQGKPTPLGAAPGGTTPRGGGFSLFLLDRKSTRLNSSHQIISYAVFCLKKKNQL